MSPQYWRDAIPTLLNHIIQANPMGLVTDVDGTISPIVDNPDQATITPKSRELLQALVSHLALVAVVSGRAAGDVRQRVGLPQLTYLGNHGLERWADDHVEPAPEVKQFRPALENALQALSARQVPGMLIEDKDATLSVHYRQTDDPATVARDFAPIAQAIADEQGLKLFQGRMIFELRPPIQMNKGTAFRQLVAENKLAAALYIGDDTTDVDALRMARQMRENRECYALAVGVQSPDMPEAVAANSDLLVSGVPDVESFLSWLLEARSASST